ncbi:hypothetical protein ACFL0I_05595 [Gemmatimonadota bacterium]
MAERRFPVLTATRFTEAERALIDAVARVEGVTVTTLLRRMVLPQVRDRLLLTLDQPQGGQGGQSA